MNGQKDLYGIRFVNEAYFYSKIFTISNIIEEYFSLSPFYENSNDNGLIYRVTYVKFSDGRVITGKQINEEENKSLSINDAFSIITKFDSETNSDGEPINIISQYYINSGFITQSPDLYFLLSHNIQNSVFHIREALNELNSIYDWNINRGFYHEYLNVPDDVYLFDDNASNAILDNISTADKYQNEMCNTILDLLKNQN